ncbi:MAG: phosphotransferase [Patescibacteria group bacterium]
MNTNPKFIPTQIVKSFVTDEYNMKLLSDPKLIYSLENSTWLLKTDAGKYYLKVFRNDSIDEIQREINLYTELKNVEIYTPEVIENKRCKKVSILNFEKNCYSVMLMTEVKLRKLTSSTITKEEITTLISAVARMHNYMSTNIYCNTYKNNSTVESDKGFSFYGIFKGSENYKVLSETNRLKVRELDNKIVDYLGKNYPSLTESYSLIHGDLFLEQMGLSEKNEVFMFDFADSSWGPVAQELAVFLNHLYRSDEISFDRWEELRKWVLDSYQSINKFSNADLDSIKPLIIRRIVLELSYLYQVSIELKVEVDPIGNNHRLELAEYLLSQ